jgi:hypothetical protein
MTSPIYDLDATFRQTPNSAPWPSLDIVHHYTYPFSPINTFFDTAASLLPPYTTTTLNIQLPPPQKTTKAPDDWRLLGAR